MEVPINIPSPQSPNGGVAEGHWIAKLVACGGRHTLAIVEWKVDESKDWFINKMETVRLMTDLELTTGARIPVLCPMCWTGFV